MRYPFASMLISEIGPSMGVIVELEPEYKYAGELIFPNGKRHLFRNTNFNINPAGSTEISRDKGYTNFFLKKHGFNVPHSKAFFSDSLNNNLVAGTQRGTQEALEFAEEIGLPVFIKPNNLSQGTFVTKAYTKEDILIIAEEIFKKTSVLLIEEVCKGSDYRVVVLGNKIVSAYLRIPFTVVGDGTNSIEELIFLSQLELETLGRPNSEIDPFDMRIDIKLRELALTKSSIPLKGECIMLLDNANLSTGGKSVDVTNSIHPSFSEISILATKTLGLQLAGVDIMCEDLTKDAKSQAWSILEMNAAPGLDNYAALGKEQADRVKDLYRLILEFLATHEI